ncbi:Hypothetical protein BN2458_PEG0222 [Helicobacter typhlonius]|uniref:Uncharacterized protein n=1 Tax=Helicobacter typhlonius TaxID=76936 RepID=A0A0S4PSA0_9HELI|nr:Hypothetical protein BN2458_PEG0222 [Helicobacter typhlonius]
MIFVVGGTHHIKMPLVQRVRQDIEEISSKQRMRPLVLAAY